ncbi:MAG: sugar kinase [Methanoregulaceae archaeon]|jgi:2-dehydro-3-deoxygluconokinase
MKHLMNNREVRIACFGEIMLRLQSPGHTRFFQTPELQATFAGSEANVAVALAGFGMQTQMVTTVPENAIGDACVRQLRSFGVDTDMVTQEKGRLGIFFLEQGAMQRPSRVLYDRNNSAFAHHDYHDDWWNRVFEGVNWFHISGITPALSETARRSTLRAVTCAKANGVTVSMDLNYRSTLWTSPEIAQRAMASILSSTDYLFGNEEDFDRMVFGTHRVVATTMEEYRERFESDSIAIMKQFPNIKAVASSARISHSASENDWGGFLRMQKEVYKSVTYIMHPIVDRVGAGDAFAAGIIYSLVHNKDPQKAVDFASAVGCLKHTIPGDFCRLKVPEVEALVSSGGDGRVVR